MCNWHSFVAMTNFKPFGLFGSMRRMRRKINKRVAGVGVHHGKGMPRRLVAMFGTKECLARARHHCSHILCTRFDQRMRPTNWLLFFLDCTHHALTLPAAVPVCSKPFWFAEALSTMTNRLGRHWQIRASAQRCKNLSINIAGNYAQKGIFPCQKLA